MRALATARRGCDTTLFQSINFLIDNEQRTYSHSIHMSNFPLGGMAADWVALKKITPNNGSLHYHPRNRHLP